jgi:serine O-acetyltransferase
MGLFQKVIADAFELARALHDGAAPSVKDAVKAAITQDGYKVLLMSRVRESARRWHVPGVNHALRLMTTVLYSIEIGNGVELGEGINFTHTLGTVIGGDSKIGARVKFMGNNTIGTAKDNGCPVIEDDVVIGCGARILGPIRIGRGAVIGANAVVLTDVPPGAIASGIPAKVHQRDSGASHTGEGTKTNGA